MIGALAAKFFGNRNERELKKMMPTVQKINDIEPEFKKLTDEQLQAKTSEFRERLANGETVDDLLIEAFATVREAAIRTMGMRPYDCQLLGGIVLHQGAIAEMKTGEGKTLTATLPVYLNALPAKGVHVVTVNDYLAKRDAEWMSAIYNFLGLTVGSILHEKNDEERRESYQCDITYGTNNEFGFDYLRDNMKYTDAQMVQRGHHFVIVDEVDSVLIDEARTPLIISGATDESTAKYYDANAVMLKLNPDSDYSVDEKDHHALFTEEGIAHAEKLLNISNLYDPSNIEVLHCLEQSLKAHFLFKRDVDYMVIENEVVIIDQHTGRQMPGRRYSDGLHQALEAKESVKIERQNQTLASVTFQNFFRMYGKLSGMTGTAETEAAEFLNIYKLECYVLPTNKPIARQDLNDQIYSNFQTKTEAIIEEIQTQHEAGRPVLVGTIAIESSEMLSMAMTKRGIKHKVLNAKYHEKEADIVAQAGRKGAVTIATNMAGRGTDIVLGGNPEFLVREALESNPNADADALLEKFKVQCEEEKKEVKDAGGLCILGTERHESRRIDNQLRGRSGRQGDPGSSQFFISLEDKLMRLFGNDKMKALLIRNMEEGVPIEHKMVNRAIERAQKSVENRNFEVRKHLLEYDDVMNMQRNAFYDLRRDLLHQPPRDYLWDRAQGIADFHVNQYFAEEKPDEESRKRLWENLRLQLGYEPENADDVKSEGLVDDIIEQIQARYLEKWDVLELPEDVISGHERFIMLFMVDQQWKDHMRNMDFLKEGIGLQGYAQKNPLIEYKKESYELFETLIIRMEEEVVKTLLYLQPKVGDESINRMRRQRDREAKSMQMTGAGDGAAEEKKKSQTFRRAQPKLGRNDPCWCGSGKKFKHCHGRK